MGQMAPAFVYSAFFFTYGMKVVHASRDFLLVVLLIGSFWLFFTIPFSGFLSDRLGRKPVYIFGAAAATTGLFAFAYYALFDTAIPGLNILATLAAFFFHDLEWGQLAAVFAGGPAPLIATAILPATGSGKAVALYIFGCAIISVAATAALPHRRDRDFARDHL
jgi:MFS family permease